MGGVGALEDSDAARAFRRLFECAPVGVILIDLEGRIFAVNSVLAHLLGFTQIALLGRSITDLGFPENVALIQQQFGELAAGIREGYSVDRHWVRADGSRIDVHVTGMLVRDADGEPQFAVALAQPMNEVIELRETVGAARSVAHDFNNLLTAIVGQSELVLARLPHGDPTHARVEQIRDSAWRSVSLVRGLLDAGGPTRSASEKSFDVNEAVLGMRHVAEQLVGAGIEIRLHLDPAGPRVVADREGFERAVANIASNSRYAMSGAGTFTILTAQEGDAVVIRLSDTGPGIEPKLLARIFERDFTTKPSGAGHGIGLANVREFAEDAGGSVSVESELGKGATFTITLPREVGA
jgi:two-component system cell cycle sensor histidine kinase/response regulator CckA